MDIGTETSGSLALTTSNRLSMLFLQSSNNLLPLTHNLFPFWEVHIIKRTRNKCKLEGTNFEVLLASNIATVKLMRKKG